MALEWKHSTDGVDWEELSALYRAAPVGDKKPLHMRTVLSRGGSLQRRHLPLSRTLGVGALRLIFCHARRRR